MNRWTLFVWRTLPRTRFGHCVISAKSVKISKQTYCYYYHFYYYYYYYYYYYHLLSSSSSPLRRVFILTFLRQTMSLGNTVLQLFCCYYSWCLYRQFQCWTYCIFTLVLSDVMCAVPNMAVFCSSLTSCFPGMLLTYFLNDFEIVPVAHIITGITFVFTFHMRCISIVRSLYFRIISASFLTTFKSPEIIIIIREFSVSWEDAYRDAVELTVFAILFQYKESVRPPACYTPYRPVRTSNNALICTLYMSMS